MTLSADTYLDAKVDKDDNKKNKTGITQNHKVIEADEDYEYEKTKESNFD